LEYERLAGRERGKSRRDPVGVHNVCVARGAARGARIGSEKRREDKHEPGLRAQVLDDPVAECDPEMPEIRGRHNVDARTGCTQARNRICDEVACDVVT
jgi:hypothetical protein